MKQYIEPDANVRNVARAQRAVFNAYVESGFTEEQALELLKVLLANQGKGEQ
jgi:hypothetical protein